MSGPSELAVLLEREAVPGDPVVVALDRLGVLLEPGRALGGADGLAQAGLGGAAQVDTEGARLLEEAGVERQVRGLSLGAVGHRDLPGCAGRMRNGRRGVNAPPPRSRRSPP